LSTTKQSKHANLGWLVATLISAQYEHHELQQQFRSSLDA
jgi:hypothetical protein